MKTKLSLITVLLLLVSGCGKSGNLNAGYPTEGESAPTEVNTDVKIKDDNELPIDEPITMHFSSGVGAWETKLTLNPDASFEGEYYDADMGDSDADYPKGTLYRSVFKGQFNRIEKIGDYTYRLNLKEYQCDGELNEEYIEDGQRIIVSEPYGIAGGNEFIFYTPGAPVKEMDEEFLSWRQSEDSDKEGKILYYGLYNTAEGSGFFNF